MVLKVFSFVLYFYRPVIYVVARKHNVYERDIDKFTKFIVYILVSRLSIVMNIDTHTFSTLVLLYF